MTWASASITASVGVPVTEKRRSPWRRRRTGVGQGQRMARAGLLFGRGDDPDVVAELARDRFEQLEPAGVHAVVVGQQDPHGERYAGWQRRCCNRERRSDEIAPYSQHAWRFLHVASCQFLLSTWAPIYRPALGMTDLPGLSPGKVSRNRLRLHRWPGRSGGGVLGASLLRALMCGEGIYGDCSSRSLRRRRFRTI